MNLVLRQLEKEVKWDLIKLLHVLCFMMKKLEQQTFASISTQKTTLVCVYLKTFK